MKQNKLSLKFKLVGGFAIVLLLMLIVSFVSFNALNNANKGFGQYREMAKDSNLSGRLQANMLIVRMAVKNYLISGSEDARKQFNERWGKVKEFQAEAQKEIQAPERAAKIDEIEISLELYHKGFNQVVEYKNHRNKLVNGILNVNGPLMENSLTDIMISANNDSDLTAAFHTGLSMKHLLLARLYMAKFLDTNDQSAVARVHEEFKKMKKSLGVLDKELENRKRRELLSTVQNAQKIYLKTFNELVSTIFERNKIITGTLDSIGPEVASKVEDVKLDIKRVQDEIGPRLQASNKKAVNLIVIISVLAIMIGVFVVVFITRSVMGQLGRDPSDIAEIVNSIANGNLAIEFDEDDAKITGVYADMKNMTKNLSGMFKNIMDDVQTLTDSSTELSDVSGKITTNSETTTEKSNGVSVAAEEMSSNMNSVAAATEQATANIQMIVAGTEEMTATIQEIAGNMAKGSETTSQAVEKAQEVSTKVYELGKAASQINKVTETIAGISEQTNLLALNATIEAARAGEAGRGFAVVAGEIKDLAKQTAEATTQISGQISSVQTTTDESVTAIETIVKVINDINEIVTTVAAAIEEQSATTQEISTNVSQAALGIQEVNENVNQASAVTGEVTRDITDVSQLAQETNSETLKIDKGTTELSKLADRLNKMVSQFKI